MANPLIAKKCNPPDRPTCSRSAARTDACHRRYEDFTVPRRIGFLPLGKTGAFDQCADTKLLISPNLHEWVSDTAHRADPAARDRVDNNRPLFLEPGTVFLGSAHP
jgi:hypothetical protein